MLIYIKENMKKIVLIIMAVVIIVLVGNLYGVKKNQQAENTKLKACIYNEKVLEVTRMFVSKVLKADAEVSFDDRLKLENLVRDLDNKVIFDQWQRFINTKTSPEAQIEVKNLLELLINNILK